MEKRTLLFIVISLAILVVYGRFFYQPPQETTPAPVAGSPSTPNVPTPTSPMLKATANPVQSPAVTKMVENSNFRVEFNSISGFPWHWWMQQYFEKPGKKGANIDLLQGGDPSQVPLSLLLFPKQAPILPYFKAADSKAQEMIYEGEFQGLKVTQSLGVSDKNYSMEVSLHVTNTSNASVSIAPGLRIDLPQSPAPSKGFLIFKEAPNYKFPLFRLGTSVKRYQDVNKLGESSEEIGDISWAGIEDRYFLRILLARQVSAQNLVGYGVHDNRVYTQLQYPEEALAPGQAKDYQFNVYLGPKDPALLKGFGNSKVDEAINYGWFSVIALPILWSLKFLNSVLHNWGLAIIALTIVIKLLLYPLTRTSMKSMKAMQDLQPQLKQMRERYKDDRERLNVETMNLFKANKVNPMGGCLPMLLQMPIYIALYKVLYNATDLFHAPFFGFYNDLSAPDPFYILPILLGISMVFQQRLSPSGGDPAQAKMMTFMPILFSAFMLFLPLGLVLYIFVNTLMTVVQQYMNQKNISLVDLFRGGSKA